MEKLSESQSPELRDDCKGMGEESLANTESGDAEKVTYLIDI